VRPGRRTALWLSGLATAALLVVLTVLDFELRDTGGPGIVGYELAGSEERVSEILAEWGPDGRDTARTSLRLDFAYLLAYAVFLTLAVSAIRDSARRRGWRRFAAAGSVLVAFPVLAAGLDAIEDVALLLALDGNGGDASPLVAAVCAAVKFGLATTAVVFVVAGLARLGWSRSRGPSPEAAPP
jgi:hypothetical protein